MLDRILLKREAKEITRSARVSAYRITFLYLVIINVLDLINTYVSGSVVTNMQFYFPDLPVPQFFLSALEFPPTLVMFVSVLVALLLSVLSVGYTIYQLGVRAGREMDYSSLFDGFSFVGKVILLQIVIFIHVFLWSLLLVVPGIIAAYRYRFSTYNLCENPEISVMEALGLSTRQTYGHKMDLFVLDLTFLGWNFLCTMTLGILSIWIMPYIVQTNLGYFQQIKQMKGLGWFPPQEDADDGQFRGQDPFGPGV